MRFKLGGILTSQWFIAFLYRFIRAYAWTFRLRIENEQRWMHYIDKGDMLRLAPIGNDNDFEEQRRQLEQTMRPALVGFSSAE